MKKSAIILLVFGILLEFFGFTLGYPDKFTFIVPILCPSYKHANNAVKHLEQYFNLTAEDDGFEIINNIFINILKQQNHPEK